MALESYTLQEMRYRILDEFGIADTDTLQDLTIDRKINEAISLIARDRPNWPWMRRTVNIDIPAAASATLSVTQGSRTVTISESTTATISPRTIILGGTSSRTGIHYVVESVSGDTATLTHQYMGATDAEAALTATEMYFAMPEDFLRLDEASPVEDLACSSRFSYVSNTMFEELTKSQAAPSFDYWYTVQSDPINLDAQTRYLAIYPAPTEATDVTVLRGNYYADPPKLQLDDDLPIIPRNDCPTVLYWAMYLYAVARSDMRAQVYLGMAERELKNMRMRYKFADAEEDEKTHYYRDIRITGVTPLGANADYVSGA